MELLCKEGMSQDSPLKMKKAIKEIRRDSRRYNWTDDTIETLPSEWQWRLCTARLQLGVMDWRGWQWRNSRQGMDPFDIPKWDLGLPIYPAVPELREPAPVDNLLVYSEQGIGDQIMFAQGLRYVLPYAKEVTLEIEPRLAPAFERAFPEIRVHPLKDLRDSSWVKAGEFDAKALMGDVVARFVRNPDKLLKGPYLSPDPEKVAYWKTWLSQYERPWVGFSWVGRQGYIPPAIGTGWVDLQYGDYESEGLIQPPIDKKEDIEDIFAITSLMDKVVCVPNTLAHIAGSLGVPTDVISVLGTGQVHNGVNWRWGMPGDRKMKWHPSIKVYRSVKEWGQINLPGKS